MNLKSFTGFVPYSEDKCLVTSSPFIEGIVRVSSKKQIYFATFIIINKVWLLICIGCLLILSITILSIIPNQVALCLVWVYEWYKEDANYGFVLLD